MSVNPHTPNKIAIDAAEQDHLIKSVTIFQCGRAEVKCRVELELVKGLNHVHIVHLPNCINEDSIRVEASGTAVILDVANHSRHNRGRFIPIRDTASIRSYSPYGDRRITRPAPPYNPSLQALEDERGVIQKQIDFLNSYGTALDSRHSALADVENFLESYGSRRNVLNKQLQDIDARIAQEEEAQNQEQNQKVEDELKFQGRRETNITVTVLVETEVKTELKLTYTVSEVSWTPGYDVRVPLTQLPNTPSTIVLGYLASIEQTTGEDWSNTSLILSTTSPHFRAPITPVLSTWQIKPGCLPSWKTHSTYTTPYKYGCAIYSNSSIFDREPYARAGDPLHLRQGSCLLSPSLPACSSYIDDKFEFDPPPAFNTADVHLRQAELVGSALGVTFKIPGCSNISSNSGTHKVLIGLLEVPAEPEWTCIPSINESVFLKYAITNSSGFTLLPGEANVFKGDDFIAKSRIPLTTAPKESFILPFGTDPALRVVRAPLSTNKHTTPRSFFTFTGLKKYSPRNITTCSQHFTIQNSGLTTVSALRVSDHIPVSSSPAVKVNILSPQELKPMVELEKGGKEKKKLTSWVDLLTGVRARWAPIEGSGEGTVEWACTIEAGQKVDLKLEWEVIGDFH